MAHSRDDLRVGLGGFGAIGGAVARRLTTGIPGLRLTAIAVRDPEAGRKRVTALGVPVPIVTLAELAAQCDVVVECAPASVFRDVCEPALRAGRVVIPASVGQLLIHDYLAELAQRHGARIVVPTGALAGFDAVRAAAQGKIHAITMVTRKPPAGLAGALYLNENKILLEGLRAPLKVFDGTVRDGMRGFPANVNVAAALSLAGIGPDRTRLEIWADPDITRNIHEIAVDSDSARFHVIIENVPSPENPRTSKIASLSIVAALRGLVDTIKVGS